MRSWNLNYLNHKKISKNTIRLNNYEFEINTHSQFSDSTISYTKFQLLKLCGCIEWAVSTHKNFINSLLVNLLKIRFKILIIKIKLKQCQWGKKYSSSKIKLYLKAPYWFKDSKHLNINVSKKYEVFWIKQSTLVNLGGYF